MTRCSRRSLRFERFESRCLLSGTPITVENGAEYEATLEVGESATLQFQAVAGVPVYMAWGKISGGRVSVRVVAPDETVVSDTSSPLVAPRDFVPETSGVYTVTISEQGDNDPLGFRFTAFTGGEPIDLTPSQNVTLNSGDQFAEIIGVGRQQLIQFHLDEGDNVYGTAGKASLSGQQHLRIVDPVGLLVYEEALEQPSVPPLSPFEITATTSGLYTAVVSERTHGSEIDSLFTFVAAPGEVDYDLPHNAFMESGERRESVVDFRGQHHVQFHAEAGAKLFFALGEDPVDPLRRGTVGLRIIDPAGDVIFSDVDNAGIGALLSAPSSGLYTAIIDGGVRPAIQPDRDSPYAFSFAALPGAVDYALPQNTLLAPGGAHAAGLGVGDQHLVQFEAGAGDAIDVLLGESPPDDVSRPRLRVVDPNGDIVFVGADADVVDATIEVGVAGLYTAVITEVGNDHPLSYELTLSNAVEPLTGDANGDGSVDLLDLDILGANFGLTPAVFGDGDFNTDGTVDLLDLDLLGDNFGGGVAQASAPTASRLTAFPASPVTTSTPSETHAGNLTAAADYGAATDAALLLIDDESNLGPSTETSPDGDSGLTDDGATDDNEPTALGGPGTGLAIG